MADRFFDNTRVSDSRRCMRYFYFRHERHWSFEGFNAALAGGLAWHCAMDSLWTALGTDDFQNMKTKEIVEEAFKAFEASWVESGGTPMLEMSPEEATRLAPRLPATFLEMLYEYVDARMSIFKDPSFKVLAVEKPFAVPLDPQDDTLFYVGRLDKTFEFKGKRYVGEHKTTSWYKKDGYFRNEFLESFSPNSQIDGYLYAAHVIYGEDLQAVWVDAALVHKTIHDGFAFVPVNRKHAQLDAWLWETRYQIEMIEMNRAALAKEREKGEPGPYLAAFPKNTSNCFAYGRACPYIEQCKGFANPETQEFPPPGMVVSAWSPFDVLKLAEIGLEKPNGG
jgi:hypothetical protein